MKRPPPPAVDYSQLSDDELVRAFHELEAQGSDLPFEVEAERQRALWSPHYLACNIIDPFYKDNFEHRHAELLDECLAPWMLGETVRIEGVNYEPSDYVGLIVTWPRSTYKSSCERLLLAWGYPHWKLVRNEDLTAMLTHQVELKAIDHGEGIRTLARFGKKWRETFPEFAVPTSLDWDRQSNWRWPNVSSEMRQAGQWSFTAYGETSRKIGGHYMWRLVDDWETDESVMTGDSISASERKFRQIENLKLRGRKHNPWVVMGTYYHYDGVYKRLERSGGWLPWTVPAHTGSPKIIFDLCRMDRSDPQQIKSIERAIKKLERDRSGDLNFPKLLPWRELYMTCLGQRNQDEGTEIGGFHDYSCQILLSPIPEGQQKFPADVLEQCWYEDQLPSPEEMWMYIRIDPAISKKRKNDQTAIVCGGVMWNGRRIACQTWIGHEDRPTRILRRAFTMAYAWHGMGYRVENIGIENTAFQEALCKWAQEGVPAREATHHNEQVEILKAPEGCSVIGITRGPDVSKNERILEMEPAAARREIWFWRRDPMAARLFQQFCKYPHDRYDGLDAFHDLWVHTRQPPRPMGAQPDRMLSADELLAALGIQSPRARMGTSNRVRLSSR